MVCQHAITEPHPTTFQHYHPNLVFYTENLQWHRTEDNMVPTYHCVKILCTQLCNVLHVHVFMFIPAFISLTPKDDDIIADATISLVPSSKQTWHCTNTCQSVIVLFTSVSHVWVCLHRAQVQSPALREQKRPARSVVTPSHPHSMDGAVGTGRPQTRSDENTAPVKPAASRNAVATARASPGQRRRLDVFIVLHVMPGVDRTRDLLRPAAGQCENPSQNSEETADASRL